jgi:hypothetical protein
MATENLALQVLMRVGHRSKPLDEKETKEVVFYMKEK